MFGMVAIEAFLEVYILNDEKKRNETDRQAKYIDTRVDAIFGEWTQGGDKEVFEHAWTLYHN